MRTPTIARNYAEVLLSLATKAGDLDGWGRMISDVAAAVEQNDQLRRFLETPRASADQKNAVLGTAFQDRMPRLFVRFLQTLVTNQRQMLIPEIAHEYHALVDERVGRVHAQVTLAQPADDAERAAIGAALSKTMGREVVPHVSVNPAILGGVVVRIGDTVMDGSVRRRLSLLRTQMLGLATR